MNKLIPGCAAEFIGTFALMFVGGACIINTGGQNLLAIALAHGLALGTMVTAFMHISGGQLNPAVSLGLAAGGKQRFSQAIAFIIAQCAGSAAAAAVLSKAFPAAAVQAVKLGATLGSLSSGDTADMGMLLVLEGIATFFLMVSVLGSAVDQRGVGGKMAVGGFGIGLTVAADILAIGPLTGASMNPARSFGSALVGGHWDVHAAYWVGPVVGAVCAAALWRTVMEKLQG